MTFNFLFNKSSFLSFYFLFCTEEGTLNGTQTAVCNSFKYLLVLQTLFFFSPIITSAKHRLTLPINVFIHNF